MSSLRKYSVRFALLSLLAAFAFAPSAFARSHWNVGINVGGPGFSVGYSDCRHCGYGWAGNYGYVSSYYPAYYSAPVYYGGYYGGGYGGYYPTYSSVYYYDRPSYRRGYYSDRYRYRHDHGYYRDRDYGHRANYYNRGRYRD